MPAKNSLMNYLCSGLPWNLTQPMCNEFDGRKSQILKIWEGGYEKYKVLRNYENTIDSLLAVCVFYRYVIGSMNGATDFFCYLQKKNNRKKDCNIRCGKFRLDHDQYNKILSVSIGFKEIKDKYQLGDWFFSFPDTLGFLRNCKELFNLSETTSDNNSTKNEEDYPF